MQATPEPSRATFPVADLDESELVSRLQSGDDAAFEEMVRRYGGAMLAVTRRFLPDEHEARDALQDAFISVFRSIDKFHGEAKLRTWLHRIAVNAALMRLRKRKRRGEVSIEALLPQFKDDGHALEPAAAWDASPDEVAETSEKRERVLSAIQRLPDNYRNVLLLRDIEELDTREAAETLGIEPGAVKVRLHRARQALRTMLDEEIRSGRL